MGRSGQRTTAPARRRGADLVEAVLAGERVEIRTPQHRAAVMGAWDAQAGRVMLDDRDAFGRTAFNSYAVAFSLLLRGERARGPFVPYMSDGSDPEPYLAFRQGRATLEQMRYINERARARAANRP